VHLPSQLSCLWKEPKAPRSYRSAVALHGHTNHSKEGLDFIAQYAIRRPILKAALATQVKRSQSIKVDLHRAYWTPPTPPLAAFRLERDQIERALNLRAMVSLTDHDSIEAPMLLKVLPETRDIPVSFEWSVPYKDTTVHLGIHNLPTGQAARIAAELANYTKTSAEDRLPDLLKSLHNMQDVLIVLNHPMWDLAGIGTQRHMYRLHEFVGRLGLYIHAFEVSGLRSWQENQSVLDFAAGWDQVVVGGGDRHGSEPSAVLNLTRAEGFSDFVHEVRAKKQSHVLLMPQYCEPLALRLLQSLLDVIRHYPDYPEGCRRWDERVFHPDRDGVLRSVASLWTKPPEFIRAIFAVVGLLEAAPVRKFMQATLTRPQQQMGFAPGKSREVNSLWSGVHGSRISQTHTKKLTAWRTPAGNLKRSPKGADSPY
jgi:hypothetical protein